MKNDSVLIVEDNFDYYSYLSNIIKKKNIKILYAENGEDAIKIFNENKNDILLVLMDIGLPDIMGYELVIELLKIKNVPIVSQSAYTNNAEKDKTMKAGCIDYIIKPIRINSLNNIIDKYFFI